MKHPHPLLNLPLPDFCEAKIWEGEKVLCFRNMPRYLIIIFCFLISLAVGLGLLWPKAKDLSALYPIIKEAELELDYQKAYLADLQKAGQTLQKNQGKLSKIDTALPLAPDTLLLLSYFQKITAQHGLVLKGLNLPSITSSNKITGKEIRFLLSFTTSYSAFKNFLSVLYKSARFFELESIALSSGKEGELFDFQLTVKTYSY